jgi:hypothetical protein
MTYSQIARKQQGDQGMSITIETRVRDLIAIADGGAWLIAPSDSAISDALAQADLVGSKDDLVAGLKATIELAHRVIRSVEETGPIT